MKIVIEIQTANSAFEGAGRRTEVRRLVHQVGDLIRDGGNSGTLLDANGNSVGAWRIAT